MTLMPDQVPDGWNKTSAAYDANIRELLSPFIADLIDRTGLESHHAVLDVAAGSGAVTLEIAPRVSRVDAIDFAERMLAILDRAVADAGHAHVRSQRMDGQALSFADGSFDRVCSNFGVIFFPDRVQGFREMHRVLGPGGRAVVTAWSTPDRFEVFGAFGRAVRTALPDRPKPPAPPPVFSLSDPAVFERELRAGGFDDVRIDTVRHEYVVENAETFWNLMSESAPPAVALLDSVGPDGARRIREALLRQLSETFGDGPVRMSNEAHIGVAKR